MQTHFMLGNGNWLPRNLTEKMISMFLRTLGLRFLVCEDEQEKRHLILSTCGFADSPTYADMFVYAFLAHDDWLAICAGHIDGNGARFDPTSDYLLLHGAELQALLEEIDGMLYIQKTSA